MWNGLVNVVSSFVSSGAPLPADATPTQESPLLYRIAFACNSALAFVYRPSALGPDETLRVLREIERLNNPTEIARAQAQLDKIEGEQVRTDSLPPLPDHLLERRLRQRAQVLRTFTYIGLPGNAGVISSVVERIQDLNRTFCGSLSPLHGNFSTDARAKLVPKEDATFWAVPCVLASKGAWSYPRVVTFLVDYANKSLEYYDPSGTPYALERDSRLLLGEGSLRPFTLQALRVHVQDKLAESFSWKENRTPHQRATYDDVPFVSHFLVSRCTGGRSWEQAVAPISGDEMRVKLIQFMRDQPPMQRETALAAAAASSAASPVLREVMP